MGEVACALSPGGTVLDEPLLGRELGVLGAVSVDDLEVLFLSTMTIGCAGCLFSDVDSSAFGEGLWEEVDGVGVWANGGCVEMFDG